MIVQLVVAIPLAYVIAFKASGLGTDPALPGPPTSSTRWSGSTPGACCSAAKGIIEGLMSDRHHQPPIDALLFSQFAVTLVLSTSYLTYTVIPIYGAMKAIDATCLRGRARSRRGLVDDDAPDPAAADRARHLHLAAARLRAAVHRLRQPGARRRHQRLHARQRGQRLRARGGRPQPGSGDEHHHARALGPVRVAVAYRLGRINRLES